jgi:quercetin 2,3-dioxygenase
MLAVRRAADRGHTRTDWLDSAHTFSFGSYRDPAYTGFRDLRVLNDDRVAPGAGFPEHPHAEMEILTFVVEGALAHRDNTGNSGVIRSGDVQRMSAGTGIVHSEMNASDEAPVHFLQIWIPPAIRGLDPSYEQRSFPPAGPGLRRIADREGREGAVRIHQDVSVHAARLDAGMRIDTRLAPGRHAWLQIVSGRLVVEGETLFTGDGAAAAALESLSLRAQQPTELLLFDLA